MLKEYMFLLLVSQSISDVMLKLMMVIGKKIF